MYATAQDLRDEGVTAAEVSDARLIALIAEATDTIDRVTGWFFEPRVRALRLDGRGTPNLSVPWVPIIIDRVSIDDEVLDDADVRWAGAPVEPGFVEPRVELGSGRFPRGESNVKLQGTWGYTEPDGSRLGRTPLAIRRACMLLVMRTLPKLADSDLVGDARSAWRIIEQRTRDQSFSLSKPVQRADFTGDPEVDMILSRYARPLTLGAA
jgi:hypothetical protein